VFNSALAASNDGCEMSLPMYPATLVLCSARADPGSRSTRYIQKNELLRRFGHEYLVEKTVDLPVRHIVLTDDLLYAASPFAKSSWSVFPLDLPRRCRAKAHTVSFGLFDKRDQATAITIGRLRNMGIGSGRERRSHLFRC
jgi:hypothetical protein